MRENLGDFLDSSLWGIATMGVVFAASFLSSFLGVIASVLLGGAVYFVSFRSFRSFSSPRHGFILAIFMSILSITGAWLGNIPNIISLSVPFGVTQIMVLMVFLAFWVGYYGASRCIDT